MAGGGGSSAEREGGLCTQPGCNCFHCIMCISWGQLHPVRTRGRAGGSKFTSAKLKPSHPSPPP